MTFNEAIAVMADDKHEAVTTICDAVEPLCLTPTKGITSLWEWIQDGSYTGDETPESIAAEWDALGEAGGGK